MEIVAFTLKMMKGVIEMEALKNPIFEKLEVRFITNDRGEKEEIVFKYDKFQKLWEEIEDLLIEEYETEEDARITHIILERTKNFETGKSKGYSQEEVEKMYGVS